jgi:hypothetical protein
LGPLFFLFANIESSDACSAVCVQVSSLVSLGLMSQLSSKSRRGDMLDDVKLRCNITHAQALALARSLEPVFELHNYLHHAAT